MKSNTYIRQLLAILLAGLISLNLSCASKEGAEVESYEEAAAAEEAESLESEASEATGDVAEVEEDGLESLEEESDKGMQELEDELSALDESADALLGEEEEELEGAEDEADPAIEGLEEDGESAANELEGEVAEAEQEMENLGTEDEGLGDLGVEDEDETLVAENEPTEEFEEVSEMTEPEIGAAEEPGEGEDLAENDSAPVEEPTPQMATPRSARAFVKSSTPQVPTQAIEKQGVLLNRFYIVRRGDDAQSISTLLFGSPSRAGELAALNGGNGLLKRAGTVVYYNSAKSPDDTQMDSFYKEAGIQPEEYEVQGGETLSAIAKGLYGDLRSWKELAIVNGLANPDSVRRGQRLFAYPRELSANQLAAAEPVDTQPAVPEPVDTQPNPAVETIPSDSPDVAAADPSIQPPPVEPPPVQTAPPTPMPPKPMPPKRQPQPTGQDNGELDYLALVQDHLLTLAFFGTIFLLVIGLIVVNKRRRARAADDFSEQDYVEPPKAKRR